MLVIRNRALRQTLKILLPFAVVPLTVLLGATVFDQKQYLVVSFAVAIAALVLFTAGFEKKTTGTRRMVIVAIMTALCVVGRIIPLFKPVTALIIMAGMYLGGESGFLVGSLAALLSNFYCGQGPWTPFQMFAWGLIGLAAGALSKPLKASRVFLMVFAVLGGVLFSFIMDVWTVLWQSGVFEPALYAAALVTAIPHTVMYVLSNILFLWLMAKPFSDKLGRIQIKYGI